MDLKDKEKLPDDHPQIDRRSALKKAGYYALSTATLLVVLKSQAKAQSSPAAPQNAPLWGGN